MPTSTLAPGPTPTPRWLHVCAVLTVFFTLPLMVLGAEVTTKKVGMVDRAGLRSPLYLIEALWNAGGVQGLIDDKGLGWVIEHSHRTVGFALGFTALALAVGMARYERRRWVRLAGMLAPFAVLSQGILGILRIELEGRLQDPSVGSTIALIHGCTAQFVLAWLVAVALWTSRTWLAALQVPSRPGSAYVGKLALTLVGLLYVQIVLGALLRHKESALAARAHILFAFVVAGMAVWLVRACLETNPEGLGGVRAPLVLAALLVVQILLGLETLLSKFRVQWPHTYERMEPVAVSADLIRSIHFLVGALTFSAAVCVALLAYRHLHWTPRAVAVAERQLEGAV